MKDILEAAKAMQDQIVADRRTLHKNPEIGFDLSNTAAYVKTRLAEMGIEAHDCGGPVEPKLRKDMVFAGFPDMAKSTGVVATIGKGGKTFLLRADMDALPIHETTGLDFAAEGNLGHMCGHDSHTAMLLGAAKLLKEREDQLPGTVKLMFQTGEELGCGSRLMIEAGLLENPKVDAAFALHVMPNQKLGTIGYVNGVSSASMDTFIIKLKGQGGHSSQPQLCIDPLLIMSNLNIMLNQFVGREVDPSKFVSLTVGKLHGGTAINIIPDSAEMGVSLRSYDVAARNHAVKRIPEIIDHVVKMWRGEYELLTFSTPSTFNDKETCVQLSPFIREILGEDNLILKDTPQSGTEDFSYISQAVPSMFGFLGSGDGAPLHNPGVILDESVFPIGAAVLANCAIEWLNHNK